jgi:hypothetical protein
MRLGMGVILWAPGLPEIIILLTLLGMVAAVLAGIFFLVKYLTGAGGKTCPYCAEKIKVAAKICRYCQMELTGAIDQNEKSRGLFK